LAAQANIRTRALQGSPRRTASGCGLFPPQQVGERLGQVVDQERFSLMTAFRETDTGYLAEELDRIVTELERGSGS